MGTSKFALMAISLLLLLSSCKEDEVFSQVGRYQIVLGNNSRLDTYVLDTITGRVWQSTTYSEINFNPTVWEEMEFIDKHASFDVDNNRPLTTASDLVKIYGLKKKQ